MTAEGLLSCVGPYMFRHVTLQFKTLAAEITVVGPLPCVYSHVVLQVALTGDLFATNVTVKVPLVVT